MRIFLAGGTGVIGRRVIPLLLADGHHVTALTRTSAGAAHIEASGATAVVADAFNADQLSAAVSAAAPDVVMHQLTDLSGGDRVANAALRVRGTRNLVDAAHAAGVARVIAQSIAWAYTPGNVPAVEATPLDLTADEPRRTTVQAIAALEATVAETEEWVVLRYGTLYGPDTWLHRDGATAEDARAGRLNASRDVTSFLHVDDAAAAAIQSLNWPSGPVNICDNEPAPATEWVPAFCRALHAPPPQPSDDRAGWARGADNDHARQLGFEPRYPTWSDGFRAGELAARGRYVDQRLLPHCSEARP